MALLILIVIAALVIYFSLKSNNEWTAKTGVPPRTVAFHDLGTEESPSPMSILLRSEKLGLVGKPDILTLSSGTYIPIEYKSAHRDKPASDHIAQLMAYCVLVEEHFGKKPPYGIIVYGNGRRFRIPYTNREKEKIERLVETIRRYKQSGAKPVLKSCAPGKCSRCGFKYLCSSKKFNNAS